MDVADSLTWLLPSSRIVVVTGKPETDPVSRMGDRSVFVHQTTAPLFPSAFNNFPNHNPLQPSSRVLLTFQEQQPMTPESNGIDRAADNCATISGPQSNPPADDGFVFSNRPFGRTARVHDASNHLCPGLRSPPTMGSFFQITHPAPPPGHTMRQTLPPPAGAPRRDWLRFFKCSRCNQKLETRN
jgi:hypothetical protein